MLNPSSPIPVLSEFLLSAMMLVVCDSMKRHQRHASQLQNSLRRFLRDDGQGTTLRRSCRRACVEPRVVGLGFTTFSFSHIRSVQNNHGGCLPVKEAVKFDISTWQKCINIRV